MVGTTQSLEIVKVLDFGAYLLVEDQEILLPIKYLPKDAEVGDKIEVFIYTDSEDRPVATTLKPLAVVGEFSALKVVAVGQYGAFLDIGLEKDLLLPKNEQSKRVERGDLCVAKTLVDRQTNRLYASTLYKEHMMIGAGSLKEGDEVELLICDESPLGFSAIINQQYLGMLYKNEIFQPLKVGDKMRGFIKKIRHDKRIDLTLHKVGQDAVDANAERVYELLKQSSGFLPYNYKTSPETVEKIFKMSRKAYKRALTDLINNKKIVVDDNGMRWI